MRKWFVHICTDQHRRIDVFKDHSPHRARSIPHHRLSILQRLHLTMYPTKSILVGSSYGRPQTFEINAAAQTACPFLSHLPDGSSLPRIHRKAFRLVLRYISRDIDELFLPAYYEYPETSSVLLFAQAWVLAGSLELPGIQNRLIRQMRTAYMSLHSMRIGLEDHMSHNLISDLRTNEDRSDVSLRTPLLRLASAFAHLEKYVGPGTCVERFLICYVGRLMPESFNFMIKSDVDCRIRLALDAEAERAICNDQDSIIHRFGQFFVNEGDHPPVYPAIEIEYPQRDVGMMEATEQATATASVLSDMMDQGDIHVVATATGTSTARAKVIIRGISGGGRHGDVKDIRPFHLGM